MTIKPMRNLLLLRHLPARPVSDGGIHLVERYHDDRMQWIVEAVGPEVTDIQVGDRVLAALNFDHATLEDGRKIVGQEQILMAWMRSPPVVGPRSCAEELTL